MSEDHTIVDFGTGPFVANKAAIPLLEALHRLGLTTRTHHIDDDGGFFSVILSENVSVEVKTVFERDADRAKFNGLHEILIAWRKK